MDEIQSVSPVKFRRKPAATRYVPLYRKLVRMSSWIVAPMGILFLVLAIGNGCRSHQKIVDRAHGEYWSGNWDQSAATLATAAKRPRLDTDVLLLDQAMIEFQRGKLAESQQLLREVRERFVSQPLGTGGVNSLAYLSDESHRIYAPEDHERILLHVLLACNSLLTQDGDAVAYVHQIGDQCQALLENRPLKIVDQNGQPIPLDPTPREDPTKTTVAQPKTGPPVPTSMVIDPVRRELAIAPLLRALVRGESRLDHDELIRHLQAANEWRPDSPFLQTELNRALNNDQAPRGYGTLYVLAMVGKGPRKVETTEPVSSQALLVADQILSGIGKYSLPPTIAPIKIAKIQLAPISIDQLEIVIDDRFVGSTENIADIGRLAVARQQEQMPAILARAVVRRIVKKGVVVASKKASGVEDDEKHDLTSFAYDAAGVIWEAAEKADLRSWSLLPGSIQVFRIDLPVGQHQITGVPALNGRSIAAGFRGSCEISDGRSTFAFASIADARLAGHWVTRRD